MLYTAGSKLFQAVAQVGALFLVAHTLSPAQQGYYYTFQSVLALQVFFELGMGFVLIQVAAHESAHLTLAENMDLDPASPVGIKLGSLFRFMTKWYSIAGSLFLGIILPFGIAFFTLSKSASSLPFSEWAPQWALLVVLSASSMFLFAMASFVEGVGRITQAARIRGIMSVGMSLGLLGALLARTALYAPAISLFIGLVVGFTSLIYSQGPLFLLLWNTAREEESTPWMASIWGFQWRIAVSYLSGYLIFQFATPVLFANLGPVIAGRYGMAMQVVNGISMLSMAWASTRQARWGALIARGERAELDQDFRRTIIRTLSVYFIIAVGFLLALALASWAGWRIAGRFASRETLMILLIVGLMNQAIFTEALYLRAHKKEPFLLPSVVGAVASGLGVLLLGRYGTVILASWYFMNTLVIGLLWGTWIYVRFKTRIVNDLHH